MKRIIVVVVAIVMMSTVCVGCGNKSVSVKKATTVEDALKNGEIAVEKLNLEEHEWVDSVSIRSDEFSDVAESEDYGGMTHYQEINVTLNDSAADAVKDAKKDKKIKEKWENLVIQCLDVVNELKDNYTTQKYKVVVSVMFRTDSDLLLMAHDKTSSKDDYYNDVGCDYVLGDEWGNPKHTTYERNE